MIGDALDNNFEIGQVVFILSEKHQTIIPGMIVEECLVKKLSGNTVSWKIKVGAPTNFKIIDSAKINGELFGTLEEVRLAMSKNIADFINNLTSEASNRVELWYGKEVADRQKQMLSSMPSLESDDKIDAATLLNSLDGTVVTKPQFLTKPEPAIAHASEAVAKETLRNNLKRLATAEEEENSVMVTDDQGNRIAVKMPKVLA